MSALLVQQEIIALPGGAELSLARAWLEPAMSRRWCEELWGTVRWEQPSIQIAGVPRRIPRLQAWYADDDAALRYSGTEFSAEPISRRLLELKNAVERFCQRRFNSLLINAYRDQHDSVAWHADDEPELGVRPVVASLSLGASRSFQLKSKPRAYAQTEWYKGRRALNLELHDGDLLIMGPGVQEHWLHAVPKQSKACGLRLNLTFRWVQSRS